ncbi:MAG: DUF4336 domain-containing protein [Verrucomicrobiales bacterium]|nr:DUF4336 domain-containing protein [Verrucomicrobiales bacterium]
MTVIHLTVGNLLLHSPTRCDEATIDALARLGTVTEIVAPNGFHDLFLEEWLSAFPEARLWIPPRMAHRFPVTPRIRVLSGTFQDAPWRNEFACVPVDGMPRLNEFVFYHQATKSLVVADLLFNIEANANLATRATAWLGGFYRRLAVPRDIRLWHVRDRAALKQSIRRIMDFPFENVVIGHGANVLGNGRVEFERALRWLGAGV